MLDLQLSQYILSVTKLILWCAQLHGLQHAVCNTIHHCCSFAVSLWGGVGSCLVPLEASNKTAIKQMLLLSFSCVCCWVSFCRPLFVGVGSQSFCCLLFVCVFRLFARLFDLLFVYLFFVTAVRAQSDLFLKDCLFTGA